MGLFRFSGAQGGAWNTVGNWQEWNGLTWVAAGMVPTANNDLQLTTSSLSSGTVRYVNLNVNVSLSSSFGTITLAFTGSGNASYNISGSGSGTALSSFSIYTGTDSSPTYTTVNTSGNPSNPYKRYDGSEWWCNFYGSTPVRKLGSGYWAIRGPGAGQSLTSPILLEQGRLVGFGQANPFGSGAITASNGTSIALLDTLNRDIANPLTLNGTVRLGGFHDSNTASSGFPLFNGTVTCNSTPTILCEGNGGTSTSVYFQGGVAGTTGFTKSGVSTLFITSAARSIKGLITYSAYTAAVGTISLSAGDSLKFATFNGDSLTKTTFGGSGAIQIGNITGTGTYTVSRAFDFGFADADATFSGTLTTTQDSAKYGTGVCTLSGVNNIGAYFYIFGGTVAAANAGALGSATISVCSGSTLRLDTSISKPAAFLALGRPDAPINAPNGRVYAADTRAYTCSTLYLGGTGTVSADAGAVLTINSATIEDLGGAGSLNKTGSGKVVMVTSGSRTYTGNTICTEGTLSFDGSSLNTSSVKMRGGIFTEVVLTGSVPLAADGANGTASEIIRGTGQSDYTSSGAATVAAGNALSLTTEFDTDGKPRSVLGSMPTTVQSGGTLRTTAGTLQKARMRYAGNLTFNANSVLKLG